MRVRPVAPEKWAKYEALTDPQKYFIYRVLELLSENIPLYRDVPLLTFRGLLTEVAPLFAEARAGRVYHERIRELLETIKSLLQGRSVWSEVLEREAEGLVTEIKKADAALANPGSAALNAPPVRPAELACSSLSRRFERDDGLGPLFEFVQAALAAPDARYAYVDRLATLLVSESLETGFSKSALLRFARWCFLEDNTPGFNARVGSWRQYLRRPSKVYEVSVGIPLPKLVERYPPQGCTIQGGPKPGRQVVRISVEAKDAWTAAFLGYERILDILEPYAIAQPGFVPLVPRRGFIVNDAGREVTVDLPRAIQPLPEFSMEQVIVLEQLAQQDPKAVNRETLTAIRATLTQLRESLTVTAESRFLHLWIAAETLLGSHLSSSVRGMVESLPIFAAFWSVQKRLQDIWDDVQHIRGTLGGLLDPVDKAATSSPDMREWMDILVNHAQEIAAAVDTELLRGRILWMGGALRQAADHSRPLGRYMEEIKEEVTHEIHFLSRLRGRLVHRGTVDQSLDYPSRRLGAYLLRTLNAFLFILADTPSHSLEAIISSYQSAYEKATATLRQPNCEKNSYDMFISPKPPFV